MHSTSMIFPFKKIIVIFFELLILSHSGSDFKLQRPAQPNSTFSASKELPQAEVSSLNELIYKFKPRVVSAVITASYCYNTEANYGFEINCNEECYSYDNACHISTLVFSGLGLSGLISEAIGDLTELTKIVLSNNKLHDQIPTSLGRLSKLKILDLSENQLTGTIPDSFGLLKSLEFLYLQYNFLQGSIPPSLGQTSLQQLYLDYNMLSGSIPSTLGQLVNLTHLRLSENKLNGKLPWELGDLTKLTSFWMPSNYFTGDLPKSFENFSNIRWFSVAGNNLEGSLPSYISNNWTGIEALWLQGNNFVGRLPPDYFKLSNLEELLISDLRDDESKFPDDANIPKISRLVLRRCSLSGPFPKFISELSSLKHLDLSFNKLTGALPESMRPNLFYLSLARNNLNGTIPLWITQASSTRMDLSYNNFSKPDTPVLSDLDLNLFSCCCCDVSQGATEPYMLSPMDMMKSYFRNKKPKYYSLYINSGGGKTNSNKTEYEADNSTSPFHVSTARNWAYSFSGDLFLPTASPSDYTQRIPCSVSNSETSIYEDARLSPVSLDYYAFSLKKGPYNVTLYFAEIVYSNEEDYSILRKRFFDIRIQDKVVKQGFSIKDHAGGPSKATSLSFETEVNESNTILNIQLYWAGKGSYLNPPTFNGPLISAISVDPLFEVKFPHEFTAWQIALITLASLLVVVLLLLALAWSLGWLEKKEFKTILKVGEISQSNSTVKENQEVTLKQLVYATGNFSEKHEIGSGYLGAVYKACIDNPKVTVAVKKFFPRHKGKIHGPITKETHLLKTVESGNLVRLFDAHIGESLQLCIYEYVEKQSLETALFKSKETISWEKRYKICHGIAVGLASLHEHKTSIVHGNLKCSNILLDKEYNPKLSDFGYACIYNDDDKFSVIKQGASRGVLAPEYCQGDDVSKKTDIYSFGVILLEIVAGHGNKERKVDGEPTDLVDKVHCHFRDKIPSVSGFIDKKLKDDFNIEEVERVLRLAKRCTSPPSLRPGITDIFSVFNGGKSVDADQPTNGVKITSASCSSKALALPSS